EVPMLGEQLVIVPALALGFIDGYPLAAGEGLALLSSVALLNGHAALALADLAALARGLDAAAALSFEAFGCNISQLHEQAISLRRQTGVARSASNIRAQIAGSRLLNPAEARTLQDPVTFRCAAHVNGALYDALDYTSVLLERDLNSS